MNTYIETKPFKGLRKFHHVPLGPKYIQMNFRIDSFNDSALGTFYFIVDFNKYRRTGKKSRAAIQTQYTQRAGKLKFSIVERLGKFRNSLYILVNQKAILKAQILELA
jgi:hypothetical protein